MGWELERRGQLHYRDDRYPVPEASRPFAVFRRDGLPPVVVVSEPADAAGVSVTNAIEAVRAAVARELGTTGFALVEHYPRAGRDEETFDAVYFTDAGAPIWRPLALGDRSRQALVARVGGDDRLVDDALAALG